MLTDLPNVLTLLRIASIPVLVGLLMLNTTFGHLAALIVYTLACITDYLDGALARRWQQHSELGRMMDPIADKLLVGALMLALAGANALPYHALFAAIIILLREITVSGLREYVATQGGKLPSTRLAKWKTGLQMLSIGFLLTGNDAAAYLGLKHFNASGVGSALLWLSVIPTIVSGQGYAKAAFTYMQKKT